MPDSGTPGKSRRSVLHLLKNNCLKREFSLKDFRESPLGRLNAGEDVVHGL
jgi:hypothetical protein